MKGPSKILKKSTMRIHCFDSTVKHGSIKFDIVVHATIKIFLFDLRQ